MLQFLVGFRKFTVMICFLIAMIVFRVLDLINGAEFSQNLQLSVVAYFATNIGEHIINATKKWLKVKIEGQGGPNV